MALETKTKRLAITFAVALLLVSSTGRAERLKDLADLRGARANQLVGYGLVVGLAGTGDDQQAKFSAQSVVTMLKRLGAHVDDENLRLRNVAAVIVTTDLPAYTAAGHRIDVTVSSVGNATSLEGGTLLASPLKGADGKTYAVAQGPLSVGGYLASGKSGSRTQKNHTTVARVPGGALVEREVVAEAFGEELEITLRTPDFTNAVSIAEAITKALGATEPAADARDAGRVVVKVPEAFRDKVPMLMAKLEAVEITPDRVARVVINERTGTVVLGDRVKLAPVAIAHGGLTLEVKEQAQVSQPGAFSRGRTAVVQRTDISAKEGGAELRELAGGASLGDVVKALNALGVTPRDLVAILQALKASGALNAELEIQ